MRRRDGFTLAEVLVSLVIVTSALMILSQGFLVGGQASSSSQRTTVAAMLAEGKMAEIEAGIQPFNASTSGTFDDQPDYAWSLRPESATPAGLSKVTLQVTWKEREQSRSFVLVRLLRERTTASE